MNNTILHINSSERIQDSVTRQVSAELVSQLQKQSGLAIKSRDLAKGIPFINEDWIHANFTDPEQRTEQNRQALATSDQLVEELQAAEILVIASPIYNFSVPAVLKAWIDQVARARVTFRYTENGPEGLLKAKKAYLVMASGGVPLGSEVDYASTYLKQVMNFLGIQDVTVVDAGSLIQETETLTQKIADIVS
ncbi:MAG: NAD(P)H-dependent oxidoreductase [Pseudomonadota bacterium]|uniref:FMN dependent NADH:quinone oxidoreductase n=1 Tax=Methylophaga aminisulfidivorans MP TaxID=1026882 RepID=F5SXC7_9GAMM|nr:MULTISPECIES: NAD(P)H-dependent oxidoreductase [Methylophaga]EGL55059.1 FMN-dependent NADH-azoreductase [Methylophaga aminisulfidivorans MP]MEC9411569.1 NAD(P)H-dependent oxidoreductase [Pseudomonadota bacterium]WVI84260.1 NAD(P)H-dependent oxidoreductase [Methylophaga thalassica]